MPDQENPESKPSVSSKPWWKQVADYAWTLLPIRNVTGSLKDTLAEIIEERGGDTGAIIDPEEKSIIKNVIEFSDLEAGDVMRPRADIIAVELNTNFDEMKNVILRELHTRIPVYRETLDDIIGFVHVKDFFAHVCTNVPFNLKNLLHEILVVPPSMKVIDLLYRMRDKKCHIAIVVDEYGGTSGLVTMEDLVEEIVGDIADEHDEDEKTSIHQVSDNLFEVSARTEIAKLEHVLGIRFSEPEEEEDEDFNTVGGLVSALVGRVPATGEVIVHPKNIEFEIMRSDPRRIYQVRVRKLETPITTQVTAA